MSGGIGMDKRNRLAAIFNIEAGEERLVILLLGYSFFIGFARLMVNTTAGTLLRDRFGEDAAQYLPYIYIGSAIAAPFTGYLYSKLEERFSFSKLLTLNFSFMLVVLGLFYLLFLGLPETGWPAIAFYIWYYVLYALIMLAFWGLASRLLDIRQSKRLFGLIGIGMVVAMIISGFLVRPLVTAIGPFNLLLLAAVAIGCCLILMRFITKTQAVDVVAEDTQQQKQSKPKAGYAELLKQRYILLIVLVTTFNLVAYYFIDNAFYQQVYLKFPESDELASFLGEFLAVASIFNLASRVFASGKLITRYGVMVGLLTLPVALSASALLVAITGTLFGIIPILFWMVVFTRLLFKAVGDAVDKPAFSVLYQALPTSQRMRVQTLIISIVEPVAGGVAGVVLLLLTFNTVQIFYAVLFVLVAWIVVAVLVSRQYKTVLLQSLSSIKLGEFSLSTLDKASLTILEGQAKSQHSGAVIFALTILEEVKYESLTRVLRRALGHRKPDVRQYALQRVEALDLTPLLKTVKLRVNFETSMPIRAMALRTMAKLGEDDILDEVGDYLDNPNLELRKGAMVGLLRSGGIEGILMAGEKLIRLIDSPEPRERQFAAAVLGEIGQPDFYRPLLRLLQDKNEKVLEAALASAGKLKNPKLWPLVIVHLQSGQVRGAAISALVAGGVSTLPLLTELLVDGKQPTETLIRVARICGQIGGKEAINVLRSHMRFPDNDVRYQILASLNRCRYQAQSGPAKAVLQNIEAEAGNIIRLLGGLNDIGKSDATDLIYDALSDEVSQSQARILLLLSFIYDSDTVGSVQQQLAHPARAKRAVALEAIENLLSSRRQKELLLPVLDDNLPITHRIDQLRPFYPDAGLNLGQYKRLFQILDWTTEWISPWVRASAITSIGNLLKTETKELPVRNEAIQNISQLLSDPEPLIRETALWTLFAIDRASCHDQLKQLCSDAHPVVARVANHLSESNNGEVIMYSTIEKVFILKSIGVLSDVPEEILATVAANMEEFEVAEGETILEEGNFGRGIYVISEGRVKIHKGEQVFAHLEKHNIFGELSALDSAPHSASVTATEDTFLFLLERHILFELMVDHVEVMQGIIRSLTRRLRTLQNADTASVEQAAPSQSQDILLDDILSKLSG